MLVVNDCLSIPDSELEFSFARSGGPGGQNVNKVSSKAILRWKLASSQVLSPQVKQRLLGLERNRITMEGDLLLTAQEFRDQERNKQACLARLRQIVLRALHVPKPRKATKPTVSSRLRRLAEKKHRQQIKQRRREVPGE